MVLMTEEEVKVEFSDNGHGFVIAQDVGVATFEVKGIDDIDSRADGFRNLYSRYVSENHSVNISGYWVPMWGEGHNLYPQEVHSLISENKLLPGVIQKRIDFLFGKGPFLYREEIKDGKTVRVPVQDTKIQAWLESWEERGYDNYWNYLKNLITDFYHVKTCCSQYHFKRWRRLEMQESVSALSYIGSDEARLAAKGSFHNRRIKQTDCSHVLVGDWFIRANSEFDVLPRFDPCEPLKYADAIAFNSEKTFGKWVYAYNDWFKGLYEWIKSSNLSPKYLNSYLKNALNAHIHVQIPAEWYQFQKNTLQEICNQNISAGPDHRIVNEYSGVKLVDSNGKPFRFIESMMKDLIAVELKKITELMSGEGKNQGKLYASEKIGKDGGWEFKEFPGKFKEYFESVISLDKRADQVILAGIGINSSITNVENDGVISKSGSDVYYNYIIYVQTLVFPEYFVCKEINRAIQMNFPHAKAQGIKLGFNIEIPSRQQEISEKNRLQNQPPL